MTDYCFNFIIIDVSSVFINFIYTNFSSLFYNNRLSSTLNLWRDLITWHCGASLEHRKIHSDSAGLCPSFKRIKFSSLRYLNLSANQIVLKKSVCCVIKFSWILIINRVYSMIVAPQSWILCSVGLRWLASTVLFISFFCC